MRALPYLLVLGLAAGGLTACGGSGNGAVLITAADAGPLKADFDRVLRAIDRGDCVAAADALSRAQSDLDALPRDTSSELVDRIQQGLETLRRQATTACAERQPETTTTDTTTTETTTTDTTTETTPTDTTTDTVPPDTPTETIPTDTIQTTPTTPTPTPNPGGTGVTTPGATGGVPTP